jgi:superfamily II DNA or RNA helicase
MSNVTLEINRNNYKIYPYKKSKWNRELRVAEGTAPALDDGFCIWDNFRGRPVKRDILKLYDKKTSTLYIPRGVDLKWIERKLYDFDVFYEKIDNTETYNLPRSKSIQIDDKFVIRDRFQAESIEFLTFENLFHLRMLALATGIGKTYCAIISAFRLKMPILIISETLIDQWCERIYESTAGTCNTNNKEAVILRGTDNVLKVLDRPKENLDTMFYISTSSTMSNVIENYGYDKLNEIAAHLGIGILCFDEFHTNWYKNVKIDMAIQSKYTWYLTATPDRSNREEQKLFNKLMDKIPMYGRETFTVHDTINLRLIDYNTFPNEYEVRKCYTSKGLSAILYWNYIFENHNRIVYLLGMVKMLLDQLNDYDQEGKILIYLAKLDHIDKFIDVLERLYNKEERDVDFGNYTTTIEKQRKRYEIRKKVIFTTIKSGGVGLDVSNLIAIFCLVPYSSHVIATQMIGRLRFIEDREIFYYDFIDEGFRAMSDQREKRLIIFDQKSRNKKHRHISNKEVSEYLKS